MPPKAEWNTDRDRLTAAALEARDWLRGVLPELDRAIGNDGPDVELLKRLRALAGFHAEKLGHGLKRPIPPSPRNSDSRAIAPLWAVAGIGQERLPATGAGAPFEGDLGLPRFPAGMGALLAVGRPPVFDWTLIGKQSNQEDWMQRHEYEYRPEFGLARVAGEICDHLRAVGRCGPSPLSVVEQLAVLDIAKTLVTASEAYRKPEALKVGNPRERSAPNEQAPQKEAVSE